MNNIIVSSLPINSPTISPTRVLAAGSVGLHRIFPNASDYQTVVNAYMSGLRAAWIWSIVFAGLGFLVSFCAEWKSIKPEEVKKRVEAKKNAA